MQEKIKMIVVFGLGILVSSGVVYAATLYTATEVSYDNTSSGSGMTNVQSAIDELYEKANVPKPTGNATAGDVKEGVTFWNANTSKQEVGTLKLTDGFTIPEGYRLVMNTSSPLFSGGFSTYKWDSNVIPVIINYSVSGRGNYYNARRAYYNITGSNQQFFYLESIDNASCTASTSGSLNLLATLTTEQLLNVSSISFTQSGGGPGFSLTVNCIMWLEKIV